MFLTINKFKTVGTFLRGNLKDAMFWVKAIASVLGVGWFSTHLSKLNLVYETFEKTEVTLLTTTYIIFSILFILICCDETRFYILGNKKPKPYKATNLEVKIIKEIAELDDGMYFTTKDIEGMFSLGTMATKAILIKLSKKYMLLETCEGVEDEEGNSHTGYRVSDIGYLLIEKDLVLNE